MAKKVSKKKVAASAGGFAESFKATASSVITEVEKAGDVVLAEVKEGLGTVTDKVADTAKGMNETQAAKMLKTLVGEIEEIGNGHIVAQRVQHQHHDVVAAQEGGEEKGRGQEEGNREEEGRCQKEGKREENDGEENDGEENDRQEKGDGEEKGGTQEKGRKEKGDGEKEGYGQPLSKRCCRDADL